VDDPVGAISVHGANGLWGVICVGLFSDGTYGAGWNNVGWHDYMGVAGQGVTGLFYGDAKQFFAQVIGVTVCIAWNVVIGGVAFFIVGKLVGGNRVAPEIEIAGLDIPEMGAPGYPEFITPIAPEDVPRDIVEAALKGQEVPAVTSKSPALAMS
jgi:Amt family ammonium transporter